MFTDDKPPVILCPESYEVMLLGPNYTSLIMPSTDHPATASDDSGSVTLKYTPEAVLLNAASGTNDVMINVIARDNARNTASCSYIISAFGKGLQQLSFYKYLVYYNNNNYYYYKSRKTELVILFPGSQ